MLHLSTVELETWLLLKDIFKIPTVSESFALAGGTSLSLQIGHRRSIDIDLFSENQFVPSQMETELAIHFANDYRPLGMTARMLFSFIRNIKTDMVYEPFRLIEDYIWVDGVRFFSIADIAAMKMHTVCGRGKKKDFFDIYALVTLYGWEKMLKWFEKKYGDSQFFFLWKSIDYFTDADEDPDIIGLEPYNKSWNEIKSFIALNCK